MLQSLLYYAEVIMVGTPPEGSEAVAEGAGEAVQATANAAVGGSYTTLIIMIVGCFAFMYFFSIRPQRKRDKQIREMQEKIKQGDQVVTSTGMYGKVVGIENDKVIIEFGTNKGVCIPVRKTDVFSAREVEEVK